MSRAENGRNHQLGFRIAAIVAAVLTTFFVAIQFVRPELGNPPVVADLEAPPRVHQILRDSCYDCHSNETRLRWFDEIVPAYWKVVEDVRRGREHLNFSEFGRLPTAQGQGLLYEAVNQIMLGAMPPRAYGLVHPRSVVTPEALGFLEQYLHPEREEQETAAEPTLRPTAAVPVHQPIRPAPNGLAFLLGYGSWKTISLTDRFDNRTVRAVLANDVAIRAVREGHISPWPDGAAFAKVAWDVAVDSSGMTRPGPFHQVEFMVKDAAHDATEGWDWGRWLGAELKPYGDTSHFTSECTGCHAPMRRNDFVFTMPIQDSPGVDLFNREAALPAEVTGSPLEWQLITVGVDKRTARMSALYGNDVAAERARARGSLDTLPPGGALARVTWAQREDPHWFGARIPAAVVSVEEVSAGSSAEATPALVSAWYAGSPLRLVPVAEAPPAQAVLEDLLHEGVAVMPDAPAPAR